MTLALRTWVFIATWTDVDLTLGGRLGLLIVGQVWAQDFIDGTLELVERLAVGIVGCLTRDVNFVGFVGPGAGGLVGIHNLGSFVARRRISRLGIGIVGRLICLGLVGRLDLAVLRVDSQEVFLPIG